MARRAAGILLLAALYTVPSPLAGKAEAAAPMVSPVTAQGLMTQARQAGKPVALVHLWATWCEPCLEEFPLVVELERKYRDRGLTVLLVSADSASRLGAVQEFLDRHGIDYATFIKAQNDQAFIAGLGGKWQGQLPASLFFDSSGKLTTWWPGPGDRTRFEETIESLLAGSKAETGGK
ncbi:MAG: TlpA disulfide reductase family protein [Nitrospirota bacterium]|jgi:thiol-disulfide isomerase/thioredoxin